MRSYVENEEGVLGGHDLRWAVIGHLECLLVPPLISALGHSNRVTGPPEDENMLNIGTLLQCRVHDGLGGNGLATALSLIASDHDAGLAVLATIAERFCREAGKDH